MNKTKICLEDIYVCYDDALTIANTIQHVCEHYRDEYESFEIKIVDDEPECSPHLSVYGVRTETEREYLNRKHFAVYHAKETLKFWGESS